MISVNLVSCLLNFLNKCFPKRARATDRNAKSHRVLVSVHFYVVIESFVALGAQVVLDGDHFVLEADPYPSRPVVKRVHAESPHPLRVRLLLRLLKRRNPSGFGFLTGETFEHI